ncbi:MAG: type II toxin-antitoxin system HicA family toxin [Nitrospirae bacterium]|nr:type II toxin-antitoxin system HicA family toxin [Fimbriimonadaceae bacterium]
MSKLPVVSGRTAVKAFERAGWSISRQHGSHMILTKPGTEGHLSVPDHSELGRGILRQLIRDAGMSVEQFARLAKS